MTQIKLEKKIFFKGNIKTLTGLHIGGAGTGIEIGGLDKGAVIRDAVSGEPYIPGSSIKGKMRSLLEKLNGEYSIDEKGQTQPSRSPDEISAKLFGMPADEPASKENKTDNRNEEQKKQPQEENPDNTTKPGDIYLRASRLIVRDAFLTDESREKLLNLELELPFTEVKTENTIDRITSQANPRSIERVPREAEFDLEMILSIYTKDEEEKLTNALFTALSLVNEDYLGGHGSRGSGKIKLTIESMREKTNQNYIDRKEGEDKTVSIPKEFHKKT